PSERSSQARELGALPVDLLADPVEPDHPYTTRPRRARREPGAVRAGAVEELDRVRDQVAGRDGFLRRARVLETIEADRHELFLLGQRSKLDGRLDDHAQ